MQQQRTSSRSPHLRERGVAVLGLASGTVVAGALAGLLAVRVRDLAGAGGGAWRVESAVELAVAGVGSLVTAWLALSAAVALGCVLARLVGSSWRLGEQAVQRFAPTLVRRVLVLGIGAGLGLAGATTAGAATTPAPVETTVAAVATTPPTDLGWSPTAATAVTSAATPWASGTTVDPAATPSAPTGGTASSSPSADTLPAPGAVEPSTATGGAPTGPTDSATPAGAGEPAASAAAAPVPHPTVPAGTSTPSETTHGPVSSATGSTGATAANVAVSDTAGTVDARGAVGGATATHAADAPTTTTAAPVAAPATTVVVQAGDTLWAIAARHLPPDASDAAIAREWPRWHALNADVVGADPDHLLPGQVLTVPATTGTDAR